MLIWFLPFHSVLYFFLLVFAFTLDFVVFTSFIFVLFLLCSFLIRVRFVWDQEEEGRIKIPEEVGITVWPYGIKREDASLGG